jgi:hypothetical protein
LSDFHWPRVKIEFSALPKKKRAGISPRVRRRGFGGDFP